MITECLTGAALFLEGGVGSKDRAPGPGGVHIFGGHREHSGECTSGEHDTGLGAPFSSVRLGLPRHQAQLGAHRRLGALKFWNSTLSTRRRESDEGPDRRVPERRGAKRQKEEQGRCRVVRRNALRGNAGIRRRAWGG